MESEDTPLRGVWEVKSRRPLRGRQSPHIWISLRHAGWGRRTHRIGTRSAHDLQRPGIFCVLAPLTASIGCVQQLLGSRAHIFACGTKYATSARKHLSEAVPEFLSSSPYDGGLCTLALDGPPSAGGRGLTGRIEPQRRRAAELSPKTSWRCKRDPPLLCWPRKNERR